MKVKVKSCPTLQPHGLQPTRLLCPWDSPGKSTGWPFPSPGDLPHQGSDPGLVHCRQKLYRLSHQGSPFLCLWRRNHLAADGASSVKGHSLQTKFHVTLPQVVYRERKWGQRGVTRLPGKPCRWSPPPWTRTVMLTPVSPGSRARGPQRGACRDV